MEFLRKVFLVYDPEAIGYFGIYKPMIQAHIIFGCVALISAIFILLTMKGNTRHKQVGRIFVYVTMGTFFLSQFLATTQELSTDAPVNIMTGLGGMFAGVVVWSGYRIFNTATGDVRWHDKAMVGVSLFAIAIYIYVILLMVTGSSLFGLAAFNVGETPTQFTFSDNGYSLLNRQPVLVGTADGSIFAFIGSENWAGPLSGAMVLGYVSFRDWQRFSGRRTDSRMELIQQHYLRVLLAFAAALIAVLLNVELVALWLCWVLPVVAILLLCSYFNRFGFNKVKLGKPRTGS